MGQIYISYSQDHKDAARKIRDALEAWGHTVWMDDPDEMFDQTLAEQLENGLHSAQIVIALLSPASVRSRTVRREVAIAKSLQKLIIPVLVEPMPNVTDGKYIDATQNLEAAISRLVKVVDSRVTQIPPSPPRAMPEALSADEDEDEEDRRLNPLVIVGGLLIIAVIVILAVMALGQQPAPPIDSDAIALTGTQSMRDAQATIAALQTQAALEDQATPVPSLTDTPTLTITPTPTEPVSSGPTDEPSPTLEVFNPPAAASDTPTPAPIVTPANDAGIFVPSQNLANPGFETFTTYNEVEQVATGWTPWFITGDEFPIYQKAPVYGAVAPNTARIQEGFDAQQLTGELISFDGGLFQRVTGMGAGTPVRFSVAAYVWSSTFENRDMSEEDGDVVIRVGIDPTGGTDPQSTDIVWSDPVEQYDSFNDYTITATASGDTVTVFIQVTADFPVQNNEIYLDNAQLMTG